MSEHGLHRELWIFYYVNAIVCQCRKVPMDMFNYSNCVTCEQFKNLDRGEIISEHGLHRELLDILFVNAIVCQHHKVQ